MSASTKVATGNIAPSRFVTLSSAGDGKVAASAATELPYGVSGSGTRNTPYSSLDDGYHAIAGENVRVFAEPGERCYLELGGTVTRGTLLKPSTAGVGIAVTTDKDAYGAVALQSGVSGELVEVEIKQGYYAA